MKTLHGPITNDERHRLNQMGGDRGIDWKSVWCERIKRGDCNCATCEKRIESDEQPFSLPVDYMYVRVRNGGLPWERADTVIAARTI